MMFKDKRGEFLLRDMMILILIFASVMTLMTIFVTELNTGYPDSNMSVEYTNSKISTQGDSLLTKLDSDTETMKNATAGGEQKGGIIQAFQNLGGTLEAVGEVIGLVFAAPIYFGDAVQNILEVLFIPDDIANILGNIISIGLYILIIFVIISAALRGGKV